MAEEQTAGTDGARPDAGGPEATKDTVLYGQQKPEGDQKPDAKPDAPKAEETKADDAKDAAKDGKKGEKEGDKADTAPEAYEDFTFPEGVPVDDKALDEFKGVAKDLNLTQDQAQKLVDMQAAIVQRQQAAMQAQAEKWVADLQADKEVGGDDYDQNVGIAAKAIQQFGDDDLKEILNTSGYGNHPALVRFAYRVGKAISEDSTVAGGGASRPAKDRAEILYGN